MEDVIDASIIKATQVSLGKYVKRPPLNDKLLKKPPFRFLHDIITTVLKSTGFFKGLFEDEELISDNVKDRESKIQFLTKVISVVGTTTGKILNVKPSKIVAGQEPDKTNELLQCLAFALDNKLSSDEAVKLYKERGNPTIPNEKKVKDAPKLVKKGVNTKKISSKSTDKLVKSDKNPNKTNLRENTVVKKESPPKKTSQSSKIISKRGLEKEKQEIKSETSSLNKNNISNAIELADSALVSGDTDSNIPIPNLEISQENESSLLSNSNIENTKDIDGETRSLVDEDVTISKDIVKVGSLGDKSNEIENAEINKYEFHERLSNNHENEVLNNDLNKNTSLESNATINNENIHKQENLSSSLVESVVKASESKVVDIPHGKGPDSVRRPSSSRPGAPRFRDKNEIILSTVDNLVVGKVNIIVENTTNEEEEESSIVIVENTDTLANSQDQDDQLQISSNEHGHLVQQILNAQKEFSEVNGKTNIEWQFGAQKAKDVVNKEIEQLRFNVQALSRVANPLGKLLDHIQEDVEIMRQELQQWTKTFEEASKQLLKQKTTNEESLLPLHSKVKHLEADIAEKYDKINDLKMVIHKNTLRIEKLLASGNVQ
ncbi:TRAF3-interacting protein 1 [Vanessa atalanta]|uniref:TRAF3-interacting protein 1 n=1 Tax=Vanessa atalanta TaxID=42275 RepID=UPI001FCD1C39|nr:TRAF3-interacting protein 1 [Vanessa atalanta]